MHVQHKGASRSKAFQSAATEANYGTTLVQRSHCRVSSKVISLEQSAPANSAPDSLQTLLQQHDEAASALLSAVKQAKDDVKEMDEHFASTALTTAPVSLQVCCQINYSLSVRPDT